MHLQLENKSVLVTGSTGGIGFAAASIFAEEGADVTINGRSRDRVDEAVRQIRKDQKGARVKGIAADMGTREGFEIVASSLPAVDILVNNLGIYEVKTFTDISDADWLRLFEVNVLSGVRLSRFYLPKMLENNWGRIVFISSESGLQVPVEMIHYGVTKTAQIALARGLAEMTAGTNVTVNSILPGPTRSEGVERFVQELAESQGIQPEEVEREFFRSARPTSLLQRFSSPREVAAMIVYVCTPLASATNGAALRVDGGVVRSLV